MADSEFVLGVDLDGVCADFYGGLLPIAARWMGKKPNELPRRVSFNMPEWHLDTFGGYEKLHRYAVRRKLFQKLRPMDGVAGTLRRLSQRKIRIRIITHRLYIKYCHQETARQTVEWLEKYGIPYWDLCFINEKSTVEANVYVEDSPGNIEKLRAKGRMTIVFNNSTNEQLPGPRANSWTEVEQLVLREFEAWKGANRAKSGPRLLKIIKKRRK